MLDTSLQSLEWACQRLIRSHQILAAWGSEEGEVKKLALQLCTSTAISGLCHHLMVSTRSHDGSERSRRAPIPDIGSDPSCSFNPSCKHEPRVSANKHGWFGAERHRDLNKRQLLINGGIHFTHQLIPLISLSSPIWDSIRNIKLALIRFLFPFLYSVLLQRDRCIPAVEGGTSAKHTFDQQWSFLCYGLYEWIPVHLSVTTRKASLKHRFPFANNTRSIQKSTFWREFRTTGILAAFLLLIREFLGWVLHKLISHFFFNATILSLNFF